MKNYTDETFLKGFIPELAKYLWTGETTFSAQKSNAELIVNNDFISRGYKNSFVQVPLILRESDVLSASETTDIYEDNANRLRYVYTVPTWTTGGTKTIALWGCNTEDGTFELVNSFTITGTATATTGIISDTFKYYKVIATITGGTLDYTFRLVETSYDLFFAYKWLELILMDAYSQENDAYYLKMLQFKTMYNDLWNNVTINEDTNEDGDINEDESENHITMLP